MENLEESELLRVPEILEYYKKDKTKNKDLRYKKNFLAKIFFVE